ncbi:MAG: hypothetical protein AB7S38_18360 [Vulcanimicrobiota bacterium]
MSAEIPILLRIKAERDATAQQALTVIEKGAGQLATAIDRAATRLLELDKRLSGIGQSASEASKGLEGAGKAGDKLDNVSDKAEKASGHLKELGRSVGTALSLAGGSLGGLAAIIAKTAGDFELLQAKLTTVQGSAVTAAETLEKAKDFAAKTPFDVKGVVEATVQLEVYGQRSERILPKVAALAAGMGRDINETSLVVGKALSGSLEGFESLRNTYGISTRELAKYGAEVTKAGGLLVQTQGQADKANQALLRIIDTRFGGAIERQAATMSGALSNAKDSAINLAASFGETLTPLVTLAAKTFSTMADTVNKGLSPGLKGIGAAALVGGAGLSSAAGAATLLATGLVALNRQLVAAAVEMPALEGAANLTGGALTRLAGAGSAAGNAFRYLTTTPAGLAISAVAVAAGAAAVKLAFLDAENARISANIKDQGNRVRDAALEWREYAKAVIGATGAQDLFSTGTAGSAERLDAIDKALKSADPRDVTDALQRYAGGTTEARAKTEEYRKELEKLESQQKKLAQLQKVATPGSQVALTGDFADLASALPEAAKVNEADGRLVVAFEHIQAAALQTQLAIGQLKDKIASLEGGVAVATPYEIAFEKLGKKIRATSDVLSVFRQKGDTASLVQGLQLLQTQLAGVQRIAKSINLPTDEAGLQARLFDPKTTDQEEAVIKAILALYHEVDDTHAAITRNQVAAGRQRVEALRAELAEEKSLRQVSFKEQLANLEKQLVEARRLGEEGKNDVRRIEGEKRQVQIASAKATFDAVVKAQLDSLKELQAQGKGSAGQVVEAIQNIIHTITEWKGRNKDILDQLPELKRYVENLGQTLLVQGVAANSRKQKESLDDLKQSVSHLGDEALTTGDKLAAIEEGISRATAARVAAKAAGENLSDIDEFLRDQAAKKLQLEREITAEREKQAGEVASAQIAVYQQEIQLLEQRRDAGENVDNLLIAKRAELYQARVDALLAEYQAELKTATDKLGVQREYQARLRQMELEHTYEQRARMQQQNRDVASAYAERARITKSGSQAVAAAERSAPTSGTSGSIIGFDSGPIQGQARSSDEISAAAASSEEARRVAFGHANPTSSEVVRRIDEARAQQIGLKDAAQAKRVEDAQKAQVEAALKRNGLPGLSAPNLDAIAPDPSKPGTQAEKQREAGSDGGSTTNVYANLQLNADEEAIIRKVFARMATQHRHHRNTNGGGGRPGR